MPAELDRTADGTPASVRAALEAVLADPEVDVVIASGPLGSMIASQLPARRRPVIGVWVLDTAIQRIPEVDGASGLDNYTFVTTGDLMRTDLEALARVVPYERLVVIGSGASVDALPDGGASLVAEIDKNTTFIKILVWHR
jgi:hypothetical protein